MLTKKRAIYMYFKENGLKIGFFPPQVGEFTCVDYCNYSFIMPEFHFCYYTRM